MVQSGASLSFNGNVWSAKGVPLEAGMAAFGLRLCVTWDLAPNGLMQFAVLRRDSLGLRSLSSLTSILLLWSRSSLLPAFLSFSPHLFCCYQIWPFKLSHYLNQPSSPAHFALPLCLSASLIRIPIFEVPEISQWVSCWCCGEKTVYKRLEKDWTNGRGEKKLTPLQCFALLCIGLLWGREHALAAHDVEARWGLEGIHVCVLWDRSREHRPLILGAGVSCNTKVTDFSGSLKTERVHQSVQGNRAFTPKQGWESFKEGWGSLLCVLWFTLFCGLGGFESTILVLYLYSCISLLSVSKTLYQVYPRDPAPGSSAALFTVEIHLCIMWGYIDCA